MFAFDFFYFFIPNHKVTQGTTTPGQFDMWKNADIPRSDVHLLLIKPSGTKPYYTRSHECKISDETYTTC